MDPATARLVDVGNVAIDVNVDVDVDIDVGADVDASAGRGPKAGAGAGGRGWGQLADQLAGLRARHGPDTRFRVRVAGPAGVPDADRLAELVDTGVYGFVIGSAVRLGADALTSARFVAFLRDCASVGASVEWRHVADSSSPEPSSLVHLPPPLPGDESVRWWIDHHKYGLFFWRSGPGFATVKDVRPGRQHARFIIDDPPTLSVFESLRRPVLWSELRSGDQAEAAQDCVSEGIAMRFGEWAVGLPYRLTRWPIPFTAI